jgi:hypothetical protein
MTGPTRWAIEPEVSTVSIDGASTLHPIRASASGLRGWIEAVLNPGGLQRESAVTGRVEIAVEQLGSGNPLIDRETRRRILARRHPHIIGEVTAGVVAEHGVMDLEGVITLRGERIEVRGSMTVSEVDSDRIVLDGSSRFDVRWWGLRPPRLGLLRVHPDIDVSVHLEGRRDA